MLKFIVKAGKLFHEEKAVHKTIFKKLGIKF